HHLVLRTYKTDWDLKLSGGMIKFCSDHPESSLRFHHLNLTSAKANSLIFTAFLVKHGLRGDTMFVRKLSDSASIQQRLLSMLREKIEQQRLSRMPSNVMFFPH
ncbi:hypothetical protein EK21DRAFT_19646, partial [Setomelanomma holmii]